MCHYALPLIFFYLACFFPNIFLLEKPLLLLSFVLLFLTIKKKENVLILSFVLLLLLFSRGYKEQIFSSASSCKSDGYYIKVLSEPVGRRNRKKGYSAKIYAERDFDGSVYTASGCVYVLSKESDIHIFDRAYLKGYITEDGVLISSSTELLSASCLSRARNACMEYIRIHLRREREGELSLLLLLGGGDGVYSELKDLATNAGMRHVIALSGMHLVVISFIVELPLKRLFKDKAKKISIFLFLPFVWLSGWRPSLLRAFVLRIALLYLPLDLSFLVSALVSLILFPHYAFDLGAIYSFSSLAGLMIFSKMIEKFISYVLPNKIAMYISPSIAAQVFSIPISMEKFGFYQLSSILLSPIASFLVMIYMALSILELIAPVFMEVLEILYKCIKLVFYFGALFPVARTYMPYACIMIVVLLSVVSYIFRQEEVRI